MTREQRANSTLVVRIPGRAKLIEGVEDQIPSHHCQLAQLRCEKYSPYSLLQSLVKMFDE